MPVWRRRISPGESPSRKLPGPEESLENQDIPRHRTCSTTDCYEIPVIPTEDGYRYKREGETRYCEGCETAADQAERDHDRAQHLEMTQGDSL
ncbi:hypothetical protein BRD56_05320 [Thermoplasmatales archaeon SW_10_69_26]|nr:MAG: hypothetical protein BRD56_05320 [Thermoplasmatales archaeon SW_10_69_26]